MEKIQIIAESQNNITVQPVDAEAYDFPGQMIVECRQLAFDRKKPVVFIDKQGKSVTFQDPRTR